jgi:hypothetical protein
MMRRISISVRDLFPLDEVVLAECAEEEEEEEEEEDGAEELEVVIDAVVAAATGVCLRTSFFLPADGVFAACVPDEETGTDAEALPSIAN